MVPSVFPQAIQDGLRNIPCSNEEGLWLEVVSDRIPIATWSIQSQNVVHGDAFYYRLPDVHAADHVESLQDPAAASIRTIVLYPMAAVVTHRDVHTCTSCQPRLALKHE